MQPFEKTLKYLADRDCGLSAKAIIYRMNDINDVYTDHPLDAADFGRCMKLLSVFPEYRVELHHMKDVSKEWVLLVDNWTELEELYFREIDTNDGSPLYKEMQSLFASIPCDHCGENIGRRGFVRGDGDIRLHWHCEAMYKQKG